MEERREGPDEDRGVVDAPGCQPPPGGREGKGRGAVPEAVNDLARGDLVQTQLPGGVEPRQDSTVRRDGDWAGAGDVPPMFVLRKRANLPPGYQVPDPQVRGVRGEQVTPVGRGRGQPPVQRPLPRLAGGPEGGGG